MITKEQALEAMGILDRLVGLKPVGFSNARKILRQFIEQQPDSKPPAQVRSLCRRRQTDRDGFALVPVRPTTAMLDVAVSHALMVKLSSEYNWTQYMTDIWARMVGAAMAQGAKQP